MADPIGALKAISRDESREWSVALSEGGSSSALEIQTAIMTAATRVFQGRDEETDWVLAAWRDVLDSLARDPQELIGRLDWVTKKWLLNAFAESEGLDWERPEDRAWLQSQDLEYHNIDPAEGLYPTLEAAGQVERVVSEEAVCRALVEPPRDTRAYFRGKMLQKFAAAVRSLNWDSIELELDGRSKVSDLKACVSRETATYYNEALDAAASVEDLLARLGRNPKPGGGTMSDFIYYRERAPRPTKPIDDNDDGPDTGPRRPRVERPSTDDIPQADAPSRSEPSPSLPPAHWTVAADGKLRLLRLAQGAGTFARRPGRCWGNVFAAGRGHHDCSGALRRWGGSGWRPPRYHGQLGGVRPRRQGADHRR